MTRYPRALFLATAAVLASSCALALFALRAGGQSPAIAARAPLSALRAIAAAAAPPPFALAAAPAQAPTFDPTIEAIIRTATAQRLVTSGTLAAATMTALARGTAVLTSTATPTPSSTTTLPPPFGGVDPCVCLTPPPGPAECADIIATLHAGYREAFASQTALARGTDTATPTATDTPTATPTAPTRTPTPLPTDEPAPTPAPTQTPRVVIVTATPPARSAIWLPFAYIRRAPRR